MGHVPLAKSPSQTGVIREVNCSVINYVFLIYPLAAFWTKQINYLQMSVSEWKTINKNSTSSPRSTHFQLLVNHISLRLSGGGGCCSMSVQRGRKTNNKSKIVTVIICACKLLVSVCLNHLPYHHTVHSPASEEPVDLFSLRVQVDVIETGPGGQTRDRGHLRGTATESSFYDTYDTLYEVDSGHPCTDIQLNLFKKWRLLPRFDV